MIIFNILVILIILQSPLFAQQSGQAVTVQVEKDNPEWVPCPEFMPESCRITVLQGNPEEPNTDIFFRLEGNTSVPNHWHHSAERMVLVSGEMQVNYEGQDPQVITSGTYAYGPPELPHTADCVSSEPCLLFIAFEEPIDAFAVE